MCLRGDLFPAFLSKTGPGASRGFFLRALAADKK